MLGLKALYFTNLYSVSSRMNGLYEAHSHADTIDYHQLRNSALSWVKEQGLKITASANCIKLG